MARAIMEFSGKELIKGEPDASSFPSGGLRATVRGPRLHRLGPHQPTPSSRTTALCIPTAFCSYTGEALDKKTPLLRSMEAIERAGRASVLQLFGSTDGTAWLTTRGPGAGVLPDRQEDYDKRQDLRAVPAAPCSAAPPAKGQELEDHYFGAIRPAVAAFMKELDEELWKLGIPAKTKHNEVAPAQHELAPMFDDRQPRHRPQPADHGDDEASWPTAARPGLPAAREALRGRQRLAASTTTGPSSTDTARTCSIPGETPWRTLQFLLFLAAVIKAVDEYQDLLRISVATAGNDHRLGADEAPPAIISIFLGDELDEAAHRDAARGHPTHGTRQDDAWTWAWTPCPTSPRTTPTATAPRPSPSPATSSSSACRARREPIATPTSS